MNEICIINLFKSLSVKPIFGVKLEVAVARSKIADGLEMPTIFRQCVHYLEENGRVLVLI